MAPRSCKLVKFFIQNLTEECVYLIEVTAYFVAVKFRINIAHEFLQETLKETQWCCSSDTCQLSCLPWCWRHFEFHRVDSVKVTSRLFKKTILCSQESIPKLHWQSPVHGLFSARLWEQLWEQLSQRYLLEGTAALAPDVSNIRSRARHALAAIPLLHHQLLLISPF